MEQNKYDDLEIEKVTFTFGGMIIDWTSPSRGFGELSINSSPDHAREITIDHEAMSPDFCKAVLNKLIDKYYKL